VTSGLRKGGNVVPFGLPRPIAQELIRQLVADGKFTLEPKARMDLRDRDFSMRQVLTALREGHINQGPERDECNDWRCRITKRCAGRFVRVVVAIRDESFVYVTSIY
jgi:hypothetical protein